MKIWDRRIMRHWSEQLQVDERSFTNSGITVLFKPEPVDRLIVYTVGDSQVVTVPRRFEQTLQDKPRAATVQALSEWLPIALQREFHDFIYYATTSFTPPFSLENIRVLTTAESSPFDAMLAQCSAVDLALAEITIHDPLVVGYFDSEHLVGIASFLEKGNDIFDIGVITHPAHRGRQIGAKLTAYLRNEVVRRGGIVQYVTMKSNRGSVRTAEKCEFELFLIEEDYALIGDRA